jgi:hypothetical protein
MKHHCSQPVLWAWVHVASTSWECTRESLTENDILLVCSMGHRVRYFDLPGCTRESLT